MYTSSVVTEEAGRGNPDAALRRLAALSDIPLLALTEAAVFLSKSLIQEGALPPKALDDALPIALAVVHGVDYSALHNEPMVQQQIAKPDF